MTREISPCKFKYRQKDYINAILVHGDEQNMSGSSNELNEAEYRSPEVSVLRHQCGVCWNPSSRDVELSWEEKKSTSHCPLDTQGSTLKKSIDRHSYGVGGHPSGAVMESSQTTSVDQHTPSVDQYSWLKTLPVCTITPRQIGRKFLSLRFCTLVLPSILNHLSVQKNLMVSIRQ